jgi:hypothetical protein
MGIVNQTYLAAEQAAASSGKHNLSWFVCCQKFTDIFLIRKQQPVDSKKTA